MPSSHKAPAAKPRKRKKGSQSVLARPARKSTADQRPVESPSFLDGVGDADYNPREISEDALSGLAASLRTFGDLSGIVYNEKTRSMICGHQRRKVLRDMSISDVVWRTGAQEVTCGYADGRFISKERMGECSLPGGARVVVREVSWDADFERAANVSANNPEIQGTFKVADTLGLLKGLKEKIGAKMHDLGLDRLQREMRIKMEEKRQKLQELMATGEDVEKYLEGLEPVTEEEFGGIFDLDPKTLLPTTSEYGIPNLRRDMLAGPEVIPTQTCPEGRKGRHLLLEPKRTFFLYGLLSYKDKAPGGVLGFYLQDEKFERIWLDAVRTIEVLYTQQWDAIVEPDFSCWSGDPLAVWIWNMYRMRWCGRFWQEAGFKIIPSITWSNHADRVELCLAGLPEKPPVVCMQCQTLGKKASVTIGKVALLDVLERVQPEHVIFYGGERIRDHLESFLPETGIGYHYLQDLFSVRHSQKA